MAWEEIIEAAHPRVIAEAASNDPCLHLEIGGLRRSFGNRLKEQFPGRVIRDVS